MEQKIKKKAGAEKWKKVFEMINEITERESLTFDDLKEIFSIGYEFFKRKRVNKNGSDFN